MFFLRIILANILLFSLLNHSPRNRKIFIPPVRIPVQLSSNFGELRIDHFHSGIDIKTQGAIGKEIVSCADGYIYRISVSPSGFGKALYVRHPSGYSTVYAHLDRFTPAVEEYVRSVQYERKSFLVALFPPEEKFPVKQGELIAYSGNSGSSGGPHLHFEIREADSELPVNPLLFDIGATDKILPVIERLAIYPDGKNSFVNNSHEPARFSVKGSGGRYFVSSDQQIVISGNAGFGLKMYDLIDGAANRCTAYSIEVLIDSLPVFRYVMDGFPFNESRYVNSHIDYETFIKDNIRFQRTFTLPNDRLSAYKSVLNRGIFRFTDEKVHNVVIRVSDAHNNTSTLSFNVKATGEKPAVMPGAPLPGYQLMPFSRTNRFTADDVSVTIPAGALYDTLQFTYRRTPGSQTMLSDIHSIHNNLVPLHKAMTIMIKPSQIPEGKESRMLIIRQDENMSRTPVATSWNEGFLKAEVLSFGNYFAGIDTVAPVITAPGLAPGANLTGRKEFRIRISDDFSGIKSYDPMIDDKWALFEYDPKNNALIYSFDGKYITKGKTHSLSLRVTDNCGNETVFSTSFVW